MPNQKSRIIIDTNIWISFLLIKKSSKVDKLISEGNVLLLYSQELIDEFINVTKRSKFKKYFNSSDIESLLLMIKNRAHFIEVTSQVSICRDAKDNFLLALSKDGKATHLVTGDKDLLELKKFGKTKITSLAEFINVDSHYS
jgi:putative PIN family toxin of toxin-antitoxin system